MSVTDINERRQRGDLPEDPSNEAEPVSPSAKRTAEDEARFFSSKQLLSSAYDQVNTRIDMSKRCTTGHWKMDRDTGGLRPGYVWIFGAETNWGKSSWLVSVADENLRAGKRVLIVTVEDPPEMYGTRLLTRRAELNARRVEAGMLDDREIRRATKATATGTDDPVLLDSRGRSVEWAAKHTQRAILQHDIDLVMFDYLHAFDSEKPQRGASNERRMQINYIARKMTDVVKLTNRAGVIFAQLTVEQDKKPTKYSIRDSRDVSNAAEVVALGWTPEREQKSSNGSVLVKSGGRCVIIDKNKSGPAKRLYPMTWNNDGAYFQKVEDPDAHIHRMADEAGEALDDSLFDDEDWR